MDSMNGWIPFPMLESDLNHDFAIRRFCPARIEQEQQEQQQQQQGSSVELFDQEALFNEIELWSSPSDHTIATFEEEKEDFVDSFFDIDSYENEHGCNKLPAPATLDQNHEHLVFESFEDDTNKFLMVTNNSYGDDVPLMMIEGDEEMEIITSSVDDDNDQFGGVLVPPGGGDDGAQEASHGVHQGLNLVHMLLACAEAVGCRDTHLAESLLNQLWASACPWGDSLQRVSYCFAMGLKTRLSLLQNNVNANGTFNAFTNSTSSSNNNCAVLSLITKEEKMEAFQLLYQTTPYIAFGFMAANEAISEAAQGKESLHIIDLGMEHALQWPSLIRSLASRPEGPPRKVHITGLIKDDRHNLGPDLEVNMKALIEDASSLGIPLEFNMVLEQLTPTLLTAERLDLREGETLFVNSIMHLHKYVKESRGSLKVILQAIKKLSPTLLTVVEQDSNHNGPFFIGRFLESLHYYSAIFDSLEASLSRNSPQRMKIERLHFAEEIRNIVAFEGTERIERHERAEQWRRQLGRAGLQVMGLKCMSQARMMLSLYGCDGYTLATEKGCLVLGWKGRPIMLASAWKVHN